MEKKYQIFISSTYTDLIEPREKVRDAILRMMHFPIGMEMFSAADEEQWGIIRDTIHSSDYYVLIVGHRYGSIIETGDDAGISYTEKEFRFAKETGIPILAFILSDDAAVKKADIETDPRKIKRLVAFKNDVKKGRIVEWWETSDDLAVKVTAALHKQMDRKRRPGWVRGDCFDIEASHAEILRLNQLVRELQEENARLKLHVVDRMPKLSAAFALDDGFSEDKSDDADGEESVEDECRSHGDLLLSMDERRMQIKLRPISVQSERNRYEPLDKLWIDPILKSYVSDEDLRNYNAQLPAKEEIENYIKKLIDFQRIRKGGISFQLEISNEGTAKATDIRVFVDFPQEFLLFKISDIEKMEEPKGPDLPDNPIDKAEEEYAKRINPGITDLLKWNRILNQQSTARSLNTLSLVEAVNSYSYSDDPLEYSALTIVEHRLMAEVRQIPHRDLRLFDGIYIVPTKKGKFEVDISIMCSEYLEPIEDCIEVEVV